MAITTWKANPMPTVFQLIAFRFWLNRKAIRINEANPIAPRMKELNENPSIGMISFESAVEVCAKISAGKVAIIKRRRMAW